MLWRRVCRSFYRCLFFPTAANTTVRTELFQSLKGHSPSPPFKWRYSGLYRHFMWPRDANGIFWLCNKETASTAKIWHLTIGTFYGQSMALTPMSWITSRCSNKGLESKSDWPSLENDRISPPEACDIHMLFHRTSLYLLSLFIDFCTS